MSCFTKDILRYNYEWHITEKDCLKVKEFSSYIYLNCTEGYEVFCFINKYLEKIRKADIDSFHLIEYLLIAEKPSSVKSHRDAAQWLNIRLLEILNKGKYNCGNCTPENIYTYTISNFLKKII